MKLMVKMLVASALVVGTSAFAGADDEAWIKKCVKDNAKEGATAEVVKKYCTCMNEKMDDNETKSISNWEKTHPDEMKACEKAAGWK